MNFDSFKIYFSAPAKYITCLLRTIQINSIKTHNKNALNLIGKCYIHFALYACPDSITYDHNSIGFPYMYTPLYHFDCVDRAFVKLACGGRLL